MGQAELSAPAALARVPLFAGLPPTELDRLGRLMRARDYTRNEVIFLEGDAGTSLCVIASGRVKIVLTGTDGREVVLNVYGPGEFFGEFALLDGESRSADAVSQEPSRVFTLQRGDFLGFLEAHPRSVATLLAVLSRRVRHTTRVVQDATFRDVPARLARVILDLAGAHGRPASDGILVDARLTQTELAQMIGASRETVNKALRSFEREGLLRFERGSITIAQPESLRARTEGRG